MTGRNRLVLNLASINQALEEYLRKRMPEVQLKVEEVCYENLETGFAVVFMIDETKKGA